ncbi:MAG: hypothetical protein Q8K78_05660 [Planctomycetaceae bacterium]|nr:hypothetical protein [Planctomycetaceae bacterium]
MFRLLPVLLMLVVAPVFAADPPATPDKATLEKAFTDLLTNTTMVGTFSIAGREGNKAERYDITKAEKIEGDNWIITARIKYGDKDVLFPVPVKVYWADDTPMISLTNMTIPGLGTFTSRVMFYGDRYAGTWQHDKVGGHMWGTLEKRKAEDKKPE